MPGEAFEIGPYIPLIALVGGMYLFLKKRGTMKIVGIALIGYFLLSSGILANLMPSQQ